MSSADADAALFAAVQADDLAAASDALAAGADVNAGNEHDVTPLLEATGRGNLEIVRLLVGRGAKIDHTGMSEGSPLMLAAFTGQGEIVQLFLAAGANVNLAMPAGDETPLHMAAAARQTAAGKALLDAGADPNRHVNCDVGTSMFDGDVQLQGETPLHFAAAYGDEDLIRALLDAGADRGATNARGETPLDYAIRHDRPESLRDMLNRQR